MDVIDNLQHSLRDLAALKIREYQTKADDYLQVELLEHVRVIAIVIHIITGTSCRTLSHRPSPLNAHFSRSLNLSSHRCTKFFNIIESLGRKRVLYSHSLKLRSLQLKECVLEAELSSMVQFTVNVIPSLTAYFYAVIRT